MASIAESMAGDRASARRLLDEAEVTTTGLAYLHGKLAVLQARALNGSSRLISTQSDPPRQKERVSPEKRVNQ
jgi:hypothetical protein